MKGNEVVEVIWARSIKYVCNEYKNECDKNDNEV